MIETEIEEYHSKQCQQRIDEMTEHLTMGRCTDHNDYKRTVGIIRGINISLELLEEGKQRYNNDELEDDIND